MRKAALAVARLDPLKMVKESGIIPERINFHSQFYPSHAPDSGQHRLHFCSAHSDN